MIEVLGLRGCGRRQVPTCACRINLQLHSRPLSFTLTVVVTLFLFATFLFSHPFTASPSFPVLLSRVPLFFPSQPFVRIIILPFVSRSRSPFLSVFVRNSFFFFSSKILFIFFPLFSFHSRFQISYLLLLKSYLFV